MYLVTLILVNYGQIHVIDHMNYNHRILMLTILDNSQYKYFTRFRYLVRVSLGLAD